MIGLLLVIVSGAPGVSPDELSRCIEKRDQACVTSLLASVPADASPEYLAIAARGYMFLHRNEEAVKAVDRALASRPEDFGLLMERGWLCQRSGDQPSAIHSFLLAAKARPNSPEVFYEIGMSFFFAHEYERAAKHFSRSLQLDTANDRAEFMLGVVAIWNEQLNQAEPHFRKAIDLRPNSADYLLHYGVLLAKLNRNDSAAAEMLKAEKIDPTNPLTHLNLGRLYRTEGKLAQAKSELENAVRLRPNLSSAAYQLATVYRQLGDQAKSRETLEQFQKLNAVEKDQEEDPIDAAVSH